ncbi:hypothetical protein ACQP25_44475 (plasmid) [Microtetraspora malaysiensis]|uniref:hypothetical protein n=1 Tax=Microtetraspora malaysiensis TaxID=161358 RepID=UPI003D93E29D
MTAANLPLAIEQGTLFERVLTLKEEDTGQHLNLADCTAHMQIRPCAGSADLLHDMSTDNGGLTIDGPAGTVTLHIPAATTATFMWRRAEYDLMLYDSGGEPVRLIAGPVSVIPVVTR